MNRTLRITTRVPLRYGVTLSVFILLFTAWGYGQDDSTCVGYPNIGQLKVNPIAVGGSPGNPRYVSLLQYTPKTYNAADFAKLYPVMIYFPGLGTASLLPPGGVDPCRLLYDQPTSLPGKIADRRFRDSAFHNGVWHKFVIIEPQYNTYIYNSPPGNYNFPTAESVDSLIDYVLANYRVDPSRIYLTGMSAGANIVVQYIGSSVARASRVAAASVASTCSIVGVYPNTATAGDNIADANLPTRFISCVTDESCEHSRTLSWTTAINASAPTIAPELIVLSGTTGPFACEGFTHNSWNKLYDTAFRFNGRNLLEWSIQYSRNAAVPVKLENYTARLKDGRVYLNWTTSKELNAESFSIEKAGADQRFSHLATVKANGNSTRIVEYAVVDDKPLPGVNYYRLVQTDADNRKHIYETRKVMDSRSGAKVVLLPNPVRDELTTFVNLGRKQRITITITDMNGRVLTTRTAVYGEGNSGITIPTTELSKGIYFVRTVGEDFTDVQKIVKN